MGEQHQGELATWTMEVGGWILHCCAAEDGQELQERMRVHTWYRIDHEMVDHDEPRDWVQNHVHVDALAMGILTEAEDAGERVIVLACERGRCRSVAVAVRIATLIILRHLEPMGRRQREKVYVSQGFDLERSWR